MIREDEVAGTSRQGRTEHEALLAFIREGHTLVVTRIDRLARSARGLQNIVRELRGKGVALRATGQPIDTSTPAGKAFLGMLGVFAEFETSLRRERQMEGIAKAKAAGVYKGRKPDLPRGAIQKARAEGMTPTAIAAQFGVARSSVYRVLGEMAA